MLGRREERRNRATQRSYARPWRRKIRHDTRRRRRRRRRTGRSIYGEARQDRFTASVVFCFSSFFVGRFFDSGSSRYENPESNPKKRELFLQFRKALWKRRCVLGLGDAKKKKKGKARQGWIVKFNSFYESDCGVFRSCLSIIIIDLFFLFFKFLCETIDKLNLSTPTSLTTEGRSCKPI